MGAAGAAQAPFPAPGGCAAGAAQAPATTSTVTGNCTSG